MNIRMPRSSPSSAPKAHFVVDGSNIATEGRSQPSLEQLNEAVLAFLDEHPGALITVVVDATFGHRIDKKEVKEFDLAVANNELVTPPAGAVGRGDAFVLSIAHKAKAGILSNDSFQEFHGKYDWLFEQGRLIGGKPVPHVGWVFVERSPVRGPKSRQSVKEAKQTENGDAPTTIAGRRTRRGSGSGSGSTSSGSPLANEPLPVPTAPPPGPARAAAHAAPEVLVEPAAIAAVAASVPPARTTVNDLVPFLDFVEKHPVGTSCTAVVESYSSHGAYARADSVLVYIPLRLMDDPPPRSARSRLKLGEAVTLVVVGYAPERRSVDAALPHMAPAAPVPAAVAPAAKKPRRGSKAAAAAEAALAEAAPVADATPEVDTDDAAPAPQRSRTRGGRTRRAATVAQPVDAADAPIEVTAPEPAAEAPAKPARRTRKAPAAPVVESPPVEAAPAKPARRTRKAPAAPVVESPPVEAAPAPPARKPRAAKKAAAAPVASATPATAKATAKRGASRRKAAAPDTAGS
jgi:hypothetical protein